MSELNQPSFLTALMAAIDRNLPNELFGVAELADAMHMSRSNLLRKVKKETNLSVSQLISQARLKRAMELLTTSSLNVTEVSQQVGFNSTSYFIKCFREHYGYPPGEVGKHLSGATGEVVMPTASTGEIEARVSQSPEELADKKEMIGERAAAHGPSVSAKVTSRAGVMWAVSIAVMLALGLGVVWKFTRGNDGPKSIAVLPFKNDSADSSNVYLINGLMEATLNNLQKIGNLSVVSRTTAEKYRNTSKSIREMADELGVEYFIEGSGQKIGNHILLNIQLIEASTDKHLWARQYRRESTDIFDLQQEIASDIAREIQVIVTPEELSLLEKRPTSNVEAYEYFLKGKENFYRSGGDDLKAAVPMFLEAIRRDPQFALAYSYLVMVYYYQDLFVVAKMHTTDVDDLSDKAILYDPGSSESLLAKALSFAQRHRYDLATPYLERALEYAPRSGLVLHFLCEFYSMYVPDPKKYLEYSIRKAETDRGADSTTRAFNYFHMAYASLQNGFYKRSQQFLDKSLALNPNGFFAIHVKAYVATLENLDCKRAKEILEEEYRKSPTRFDLLEDIGMMNFMLRDYKAASVCYDSALKIMNRFGMDILKPEYLRIGITYERVGDTARAKHYIDLYKEFLDQDQSIYKDIGVAMYELHKGNKQKALDLITRFADNQDYFISLLLLFDSDPLADGIRAEKAFTDAMKKMNENFWRGHRKLDQQFGDRMDELLRRN